MADSGSPIIQVETMAQVCMIVDDLEKTMQNYRDMLGIGSWTVFDFDDSMYGKFTYHGKPAKFKIRVALGKVGPLEFELIQPKEGKTFWSDFLKDHGQGIHHLLVRVDEPADVIQDFEKRGFHSIQMGHITSGPFAGRVSGYLDTVKALGFTLEIAKKL